MTWQDQHDTLARLFTRHGIIGHQVKILQRAEQEAFRRSIDCVKGNLLVSDCLQDIVARAYAADRPISDIVNLPQLTLFIGAFRTLRCSYNVFWQGYYAEAYGGLRSIIENVCLLAAFAHDRIPDRDLHGDEKSRKRAFKAVVKDSTKIDDDDRKQLTEFHDILCTQVHGSGISRTFLFMDAMEGHRYPSIEPYFDENKIGLYCNASANVMWAMLRVWRTMPDRPNDAQWNDEYNALEAALRSMVLNQANQLAAAMGKWIEGELNFQGVPLRMPKGDVKTKVRMVAPS